MPIAVDIDVMLARRKMSVGELADRVGITPANLAVLKNGRARAVRFATLAALCEVLNCQPGDLLRWEPEDAAGASASGTAGQPLPQLAIAGTPADCAAGALRDRDQRTLPSRPDRHASS
ncbi:putative transcriptional regulator [Frankia sp. AiPs1]